MTARPGDEGPQGRLPAGWHGIGPMTPQPATTRSGRVASSGERIEPGILERGTGSSPRILLAGMPPFAAAGNSVSTEVLLDALRDIGSVGLLEHRISPLPRYREEPGDELDAPRIALGTQPFSIHGEALLGGWFHRARLRTWQCGWAVNSRYAGGLLTAGIPYAIWEATTTRDELRALDLRAIRRGGGSGVGHLLHRALLPIGERLEGLLYRCASLVLAMSPYTRDQIVNTHHLAPERVSVLLHPPTRAFLRALQNVPGAPTLGAAGADRPTRLLFVGRVADPRKNVDLLFAALRRLRGEGLSLTLTVVGPYTRAWRDSLRMPPEHEGIELAGRVDVPTLARAYRTHDLLVVPSRQEGFGIVVAEAMHAGLPVIATRCGGPEHVIRESAAGLFADSTVEGLASAIRELATDPARRRAMTAHGAVFAARELSPERFAARVAALTRRLTPSGVQPNADDG